MGKGMRVRESATFRRLDCAFPRAALTELFEMEMKEIIRTACRSKASVLAPW